MIIFLIRGFILAKKYCEFAQIIGAAQSEYVAILKYKFYIALSKSTALKAPI